jgi:hypothetical protein
VNVETKDGEGRNLTCGDPPSKGESWLERDGVKGESGKAPGRLRIDLVEAVLCSVARDGESIPLLKID